MPRFLVKNSSGASLIAVFSGVVHEDIEDFIEIPEGIVRETDPKYLYEIFNILMDNAAKYCDEGY